MPLGEKHTPQRAEARKMIEERFRGKTFSCRSAGVWIRSHDGETCWHLYKAFDEFRTLGYIVSVSGQRRSTVYRWDASPKLRGKVYLSATVDLLDALKEVVRILPQDQDGLMKLGLDAWIYDARAAIKKAETGKEL